MYLPSELDAQRMATAASPLLARASFPGITSFEDGTNALACAVSGGADSCVLAMLALVAGHVIDIHHVDHGLRSDSPVDAAFVQEFANTLGHAFAGRVRFYGHRVDVAPGPNIEARARSARFAVLPRVVATGHTADDVAETVLLNVVRGSGLDGLAVLRGDGERLHPIRGLRRFETLSFCREVGIEPFDDPMNSDRSLQRVRMRTEVIPMLGSIASRDVVPLLVRLGEVASDDVDLLNELASEIDATNAKEVAAAPAPLAKRALRHWLRDKGPGLGYVPSRAVVERVYAVACGLATAAEIGGGWRVARTQQRLRLEASDPLQAKTHS